MLFSFLFKSRKSQHEQAVGPLDWQADTTEPPRMPNFRFITSTGEEFYNPQLEASQNDSSNLDDPTDPENPIVSSQQIKPGMLERRNTKGVRPLPPKSVLIEPFSRLKSSNVLTPSREKSASTSPERHKSPGDSANVSEKPTCSLSMVCYSRGCSTGQVIVALRDKFPSEDAFNRTLAKSPQLITTDEQLFEKLRGKYFVHMCGFWRRNFSLKTLRRLRLLSFAEDTRPTHVPMDELTMQEVLYAFNYPSKVGVGTDWIEWVFRLRQPDKRHALEFVEGWNGTRIAIMGLFPCLASTLVGVIWSATGGDVQTAFTVAGFILTVTTVLLALLAVISSIDSKTY